jgi:V/A-type H+-transporting ATPase subunit K
MLTVSDFLLPLVAVILIVGPLWLIVRHGVNRKNARAKVLCQMAIFAGVMMVCLIMNVHNFTAYAEDATSTASSAAGMGYMAAAIAVTGSSLGAGFAVAKAAPAAIGAISENPDNFGKAIIFVALGEGVAIYGLLISILIINAL